MAESGGLFIIDGENAGSTPWEFDSVYNGGSNVFSLQAGAKNNGDYGYSIVFDGVNKDCYTLKAFVSTKDEVYVRAYVYIDSGMVVSAWGLLKLLAIRDGTTTLCAIRIRNFTASPDTPNKWRVSGQDLTAADSLINYSTDVWHCIEMHWKKGTGADGGAQVWVDGDSIFSEFDNDLTTYSADDIMIGTQYDNAPTLDDFLYFDDIKADTSYIGAYSAADAADIRWADGQPIIEQSEGTSPTILWADGQPLVIHEYSSGGYTITIESGSFSLVGTAVDLERVSKISAEAGSFSLAGQDVDLNKGRSLIADTGNFLFTGQAVNLLRGFNISIESGTFNLVGQDINLLRGFNINIESGVFNFIGQDADLLRGYNIDIGLGVFNLAGQAVDLLKGFIIDIGLGIFNLAGQDVDLIKTSKITIEVGAFSLIGQDASFEKGSLISIEPGTFILTGQDANLLYSGGAAVLMAESGSFTLAGQDIDLKRTGIVGAEAGAFTFAGQDVALLYNRLISIGVGAYVLIGFDADLLYDADLKVFAESGAFVLVGQDVVLVYSGSKGIMTPWLVSSILAGVPNMKAAKMIPPSIVAVAKDTGKPTIEKVERPLVPSIDDIKGPF